MSVTLHTKHKRRKFQDVALDPGVEWLDEKCV